LTACENTQDVLLLAFIDNALTNGIPCILCYRNADIGFTQNDSVN